MSAALVLSAVGVVRGDPPRSHVHHTGAGGLNDRVQLMTKELDLDADQQAKLKGILLAQRAEMTKVWTDSSVPAAVRVATTQAVSERTADRIRGMLSEEQRLKYAKAHQRDAPVGAKGGNVQQWLKSDAG
jgi:Spy/CpxP family protein refolding chaperone